MDAGPTTRRQVTFGLAFGAASLGALAVLAPSSAALLDPEEALLAVFWLAGVALALWWSLSLLLCLAATRSGSPVLRLLSERVAMPIARKVATGSLAVGLVALPACGTTEQAVPEMVLVESGVQTTTTSLATTSSVVQTVPRSIATTSPSTIDPSSAFTDALDSGTTEQTPQNDLLEDLAEDSAQAPEAASPTDSTQTNYTVRTGDNLWSIAKSQLTRGAATPTNTEVAKYWGELMDLNRSSLTSGNVNLIYPGEVLDLPDSTFIPKVTMSDETSLPADPSSDAPPPTAPSSTATSPSPNGPAPSVG